MIYSRFHPIFDSFHNLKIKMFLPFGQQNVAKSSRLVSSSDYSSMRTDVRPPYSFASTQLFPASHQTPLSSDCPSVRRDGPPLFALRSLWQDHSCWPSDGVVTERRIGGVQWKAIHWRPPRPSVEGKFTGLYHQKFSWRCSVDYKFVWGGVQRKVVLHKTEGGVQWIFGIPKKYIIAEFIYT